MDGRTYVVAQLGARMHYAVPRVLQRSGQLERFYTDICATRGWPSLLKLIPKSLRQETVNRLLSRVPRGVDPRYIIAFNNFGYQYAKRRNSAGRQGRFLVHLWAGREFGRRVLQKGFGSAGGVFTFNSAGLEILRSAKQLKLKAITEQTITPMRIELGLLRDEKEQFPEWGASIEAAGASDYCDREEEEWKSADLIVCACDFVRDGISKCGGPVEKCVVVPYGVDLPVREFDHNCRKLNLRNRALRVLTVGTVGLRKGSPYILEAARRLKGQAQFRLVGNIEVPHDVEIQLRGHLELAGVVSRNNIAEHFAWADVFLLPSLCEGSATVTYEALSYGLPVICTANTGSVVRDRVEGFIIPIRDAAAIEERLLQFVDDSELLKRMSANAAARAEDFTVTKYGDRLTHALSMYS